MTATLPTEDDDFVDVEIEAVETAYNGFLSVELYSVRVPLFNGGFATIRRELLERGTSVCILPYDPRTDRVLLIRQFLIGSFVAGRPPRPLQVIAGMVNDRETDEAAARREAIEEAGCQVRRIIRAQAFLPTPGGSSERVVAFCGEADLANVSGVYGAADEDEDIRCEAVSADEAIALLDAGRIESGPAVVVLSWFARHREHVRAEWAAGRSRRPTPIAAAAFAGVRCRLALRDAERPILDHRAASRRHRRRPDRIEGRLARPGRVAARDG